MSSILVPFFVLWVVLAAVVVAMVVYRRSVASHEDDALHLSQSGTAAQQLGVAHKLEQIDKWGKILTAVVVFYGLILGGIFLYQSWVSGSRLGV